MSMQTSNSLGKDAWLRLRANRMAMLSLFVLIGIFIISLLGPLLSSFSYQEQNLDKVFQPPDKEHFLGTDNLGRDLFARTTYGGRISLAVGLLATLVSLLIGVSYGMIAGYAGGRIDSFMMRGVDVLYSLPFIIFVILLMVLFGRNFLLLFIAIGAVEWLTMARITRAQTLNLSLFFRPHHRLELFCPSRILKDVILLQHFLPRLDVVRCHLQPACFWNIVLLKIRWTDAQPVNIRRGEIKRVVGHILRAGGVDREDLETCSIHPQRCIRSLST